MYEKGLTLKIMSLDLNTTEVAKNKKWFVKNKEIWFWLIYIYILEFIKKNKKIRYHSLVRSINFFDIY